MPTSPFMDTIRDVCHSVFLNGHKKISAIFILNRQLEMSEESHRERVEITVGTLRKFDVPFSDNTCGSSLKESKAYIVIYI